MPLHAIARSSWQPQGADSSVSRNAVPHSWALATCCRISIALKSRRLKLCWLLSGYMRLGAAMPQMLENPSETEILELIEFKACIAAGLLLHGA